MSLLRAPFKRFGMAWSPALAAKWVRALANGNAAIAAADSLGHIAVAIGQLPPLAGALGNI